jgi:hypothetical protein
MAVLHLAGYKAFKQYQACQRFAADAMVKQAVSFRLYVFNTIFFYAGIKALVPQWERYLVCTIYVEVGVKFLA